MLSPLRESMNRSPYSRRFSKERTPPERRSPSPLKTSRITNQMTQDLVRTCDNDINNFRVHKSIAENLFKGYNVYQKKKQKSGLTPQDKSQAQKHKYTPQKQIKEQVQKVLNKGQNTKDTEKSIVEEEDEQELVLVKVGRLGIKEDNSKPQRKMPRAKTIHRASNSVFQNLKNLNLSLVSQTLTTNLEKQQLLQTTSITPLQKKPVFNLDVGQTQYISNSHYRSRSTSGLRPQILQSTRWLNENMVQQQNHRQKIQSTSQSPERKSIDKVNLTEIKKQFQPKLVTFGRTQKLQLDTSLERLDKSQTRISIDVDSSLNTKLFKPVLTQQTTVPKHNFNPGNNKTPIRANVFAKKPQLNQEVIKEEKQQPIRDFKLSVSPMRGSLQQDPEKQNTWIQSQISKEKARLIKNYSLYSVNKTQKVQKQQ